MLRTPPGSGALLQSAIDPLVAIGTLAAVVSLFGTHRLLPVVWPRVLAAEGMQKTAVIAGANDLGRRLAARLRQSPLLGISFAGYFDDRALGRLQHVAPRENLGGLSALADYAR